MADMEGMAGTKSSLTWVVNLSAAALVILWLLPTLGLFISSFRDRDQISASARPDTLKPSLHTSGVAR